MERPRIVLDASVVVKWFTREKWSDEANLVRTAYLQERIDILAPSLLTFEVANALRYSPALGSDDLKTALKDLEDLQLTYWELRGEVAELTVDTAFKYGLTVYDASYIALALATNSPLYTADERILSKSITAKAVNPLTSFVPP